jgi:hypothetical protein
MRGVQQFAPMHAKRVGDLAERVQFWIRAAGYWPI